MFVTAIMRVDVVGDNVIEEEEEEPTLFIEKNQWELSCCLE